MGHKREVTGDYWLVDRRYGGRGKRVRRRRREEGEKSGGGITTTTTTTTVAAATKTERGPEDY